MRSISTSGSGTKLFTANASHNREDRSAFPLYGDNMVSGCTGRSSPCAVEPTWLRNESAEESAWVACLEMPPSGNSSIASARVMGS
jgi:hypothetical protein